MKIRNWHLLISVIGILFLMVMIDVAVREENKPSPEEIAKIVKDVDNRLRAEREVEMKASDLNNVTIAGIIFRKDATWDELLPLLNRGRRVSLKKHSVDTFDDVRKFPDGSVHVFTFSRTDSSPYRLITIN